MKNRTLDKHLKEIADKINNATKYEIENPTLEDIKKLKDFDYIITPTDYFDVKINKRYEIISVLGMPTVFWLYAEDGNIGYEIGDSCMGMIPETYTAEDVLIEMKAFKGEIE